MVDKITKDKSIIDSLIKQMESSGIENKLRRVPVGKKSNLKESVDLDELTEEDKNLLLLVCGEIRKLK